MFGIGLGMLAVYVLLGLIVVGSFMSESFIGAAISFSGIILLTYFGLGFSIWTLLIYGGIYLGLGVAWATYRTIKNIRRDYDERIAMNKKMKLEETPKEALSKVIEDVSFLDFSYRVFFMAIDVIDYFFKDLLKDLFISIKKKIRAYLFKSILGEKEHY